MANPWDVEEDGICALPLRVVRPLVWEYDDAREAVRLELARSGRETWYKPFIIPVLEGLEAEENLPAIVARVLAREPARSRDSALRLARSLVYGLYVEGHVDMVLPPTPPVFEDRFEVVKELGRGGMGIAWLARDTARPDAPDVVVKHAWNWTGPLERRDRRIREEADVMVRFDHPRIARLIDSFERDGVFHMVRDYIDGEELVTRVMREGPPAPEARRLLIGHIGDAVAHMHDRGVLCLDMNPANHMLPSGGGPGDVILSDVGHCKPADEDGNVRLKGLWGTRKFMAPEVRRRPQVATRRSDVYSLGCLYAFLVAGRSPNRDDGIESLMTHLEKAGADAAELSFLRACVQDGPAARPASIAEALKHLDG